MLIDKVEQLIEMAKYANWFTDAYLKGTKITVFTNNKTIKSTPQLDTSNITDFTGAFGGCAALETIKGLNTSNGTNFANMFSNCQKLREIPLMDTSKGQYFQNMFSSCKSITTIPKLDVSQGINFTSMFGSCTSLTYVPELDTKSSNTFTSMFNGCTALETVESIDLSRGDTLSNMFYNCGELRRLGVKGLIKSVFKLSSSPKLTVDTAKHIICSLYDYSTISKSITLYLHADTWALLDAEGNTAPHGGTWKDYVESLGWNY